MRLLTSLDTAREGLKFRSVGWKLREGDVWTGEFGYLDTVLTSLVASILGEGVGIANGFLSAPWRRPLSIVRLTGNMVV